MTRKTRTTRNAADPVSAPEPVTEAVQDTLATGITPSEANTQAKDSLQGGAPEQAEADRGTAVLAAQPEVAAPDATSATDTDRPSTVGEDAGESGLTQHPAAEAHPSAVTPDPQWNAIVDGTFLPERISSLPPSATPETGVGAGGGLGDVVAVVICHVAGGRRRAGRRWAQGETYVMAGELDVGQLDVLRSDTSFLVHVAPGNEG